MVDFQIDLPYHSNFTLFPWHLRHCANNGSSTTRDWNWIGKLHDLCLIIDLLTRGFSSAAQHRPGERQVMSSILNTKKKKENNNKKLTCCFVVSLSIMIHLDYNWATDTGGGYSVTRKIKAFKAAGELTFAEYNTVFPAEVMEYFLVFSSKHTSEMLLSLL